MSRVVLYGPSSLRRTLRVGDLPDANLVPFAEDVAIERGVAVCEACYHIAAIRSLHAERASAVHDAVRCVKGAVQDTTAQSDDELRQQAAHLLPGTITVGERPVWRLAEPPAARPRSRSTDPRAAVARRAALALAVDRVQLATEQIFAETTVLPAVFNRADSQAEIMAKSTKVRGLKLLFGDTVQRMWRAARVDASRPLAIDRDAVLTALTAWFAQISEVYEAASAEKQNRVASAGAKALERTQETRILAAYGNSFRVANPARFIASHAGWLAQRYPVLDSP